MSHTTTGTPVTTCGFPKKIDECKHTVLITCRAQLYAHPVDSTGRAFIAANHATSSRIQGDMASHNVAAALRRAILMQTPAEARYMGTGAWQSRWQSWRQRRRRMRAPKPERGESLDISNRFAALYALFRMMLWNEGSCRNAQVARLLNPSFPGILLITSVHQTLSTLTQEKG